MEALYTQCKLNYVEKGPETVGVAWIRADKKPCKGKRLMVGDSKDELEEVVVLEVYASTDQPMHQFAENWHKNNRRTDI